MGQTSVSCAGTGQTSVSCAGTGRTSFSCAGTGQTSVSRAGSHQTSVSRAGADVVGIGGFSGRESEVSTDWLADAVASGRVRRVVTDGSYGMGPPHRGIGASRLMAAVQQTCAPVSSVSGLYDCAGKAGALRAAG